MKARNEDVLDWSLAKLANALRKKEISPVEVTKKLLKRIEDINPLLNAYITVTAEEALESASRAEAEILAGNWKGPLHGIPVGLKDIIFTRNIRTTMGSAVFQQFVPDYDAAVVEKLKQAGLKQRFPFRQKWKDPESEQIRMKCCWGQRQLVILLPWQL